MVNLFGPADLSLNDFPETLQNQDDGVADDQAQDHEPASMPAVEVIEVNDDTAWALWEDSVAFQDSKFSDEAAFASTLQMPLDSAEVTVEFIDPFSSVHKKSR